MPNSGKCQFTIVVSPLQRAHHNMYYNEGDRLRLPALVNVFQSLRAFLVVNDALMSNLYGEGWQTYESQYIDCPSPFEVDFTGLPGGPIKPLAIDSDGNQVAGSE